MNIKKLKNNNGNLFEAQLIIPEIYEDKRGFFYESWNEELFNKYIGETKFCQDNHSLSKKGVLRGLHYQLNPYAQGKLINCTAGKIYDIAVDLRKDSATFKEWIGIELSSKNKFMLWIPEGFAHGFLTLSDTAEVQYKTTKKWHKEAEKSIIWNDRDLNLKWPVKELDDNCPILSIKDEHAMTINEAEEKNYLY